MKKQMIFSLFAILSIFGLAANPFSRVDGLYHELQNALNDPQEAESILQEITLEQDQGIQMASEALGYILEAQPLILGGKAELAALQLLGYDSLYLYESDRDTLGEGTVNYFTRLKGGYITQNLVSHFGPEAAVASWFQNIRPMLVEAGINAPTEPAGQEYDYEVITLIDYNVDLLRGLNPQNPFELVAIHALMEVNQQAHLMAVDFTAQGVDFVGKFSSIVQNLENERDGVADPEVLNAVLSSLPDNGRAAAFQIIGSVYQTLATYVDENGNTDKDGYIALYDQLRPILIQASQ